MSKDSHSRREMLGILGAAAFTASGGGCGISPRTRAGSDASFPNVVIIVTDTVRRDRITSFGYGRETTPAIDEFAGEACTFRQAYSTSCWTSPAHASLFTGLYPIAHGATQEDWFLRPGPRTLAEYLTSLGYYACGVVENPMVARSYGFARGFHEYHELWRGRKGPGEPFGTVGCIRSFLERLALRPASPLFLFVNLISAHAPYFTSGPFGGDFTGKNFSKLNRYSGMTWPDHYLGRLKHTPEDFQRMSDHYDEAVRYVDDTVGRIVGELKDGMKWDNALCIVTSDHGEHFGEHGMMVHNFSLHESLTRIPLFIRAPGHFEEGASSDRPVQLTDVLPSLMSILGSPEEGADLHGTDLLQDQSDQGRPVFCEYYHPKQVIRQGLPPDDRTHPALAPYRRRIRSVVVDRMKLIWGSDGNHELYDLADDPDEMADRIADPNFAHTRSSLMGHLHEFTSRFTEPVFDEGSLNTQLPDAETEEELRSIGYLD
ncbi:MAG: sulfatase [bacterium]|nr:sulfatase [bacterium]